MEQKIIFLILFLFPIFKLGFSMDGPIPLDVIYDEKSFTFIFENDRPYFTRFILYQNETTERSEMATNYFNCSLVKGERHCLFHSNDPFSRLWGSLHSRICGREESSPVEDCSFLMLSLPKYPKASNLKYSKKPKTSGEDIVITGSYLRLIGGPNFLMSSFDLDNPFVVKGNFSDPSFDCNNITITFPPGSGTFRLYYDEIGRFPVTFSYESPKISSTVSDSLKQILTINGDNFFTDKKLVKVSFDGINQPNFNISMSQLKKIIGDKQCNFTKSTSTELECTLDHNDHGGKNLPVNVNFGGCSSTSPKGVTFTYNIPTLSSGSYSNGTVTLIGTNLGTSEESSIQLYGDGIDDNENIDHFNVSSSDEKSLTFELPPLRCRSFNIKFTRSNITANTLSISASLSINVTNRSTVSNGMVNIEIYYMDCTISSSEPSITVVNSSASQCYIPSLQPLSKSRYYVTKCPTPYGTGTNKDFKLKLNSETASGQFSYEPPKVEGRTFSDDEGRNNIILHGNNFGNSTSLIQVYFNGSDISSDIIELDDHQFSFKRLISYENGPINITVDGNNMESLFYLTLPPVIYGIINKDNKTLACQGLITVYGKNLLTSDNEFKVKVFGNNKTTKVISQDETILIVRAESKDCPILVSTFIGNVPGPKATLTCFDPKVFNSAFDNNNEGIGGNTYGYSFSDILKASLSVPSKTIPLSCGLKCSSSPNDIFYDSNTNISSNETDITNNMDCLSCHSNELVNETSGVLHLQFGLISFHHNVTIKLSLSPSSSTGAERNSKKSKLSDGAIAGITIGCVAFVGCLCGCFFYFKITTRVKNYFK
ncbi:hypothetical protein ACTFIR_011840 [Dictyostelium discoideum]